MVLITEYRVVLPMAVEEYKAAQLYSVAEASKNETGGGEGIEVVMNEPFDKAPEKPLLGGRTEGQYTHKIYHLASRVPGYVRLLAPNGSLDMHEVAWNSYPYCRTIITNPDYMKDNFFISIETMHLGDRGQTENAHELPKDKLDKRKVVLIDIANDPIPSKDYKCEWDPKIFKSQKTGRGPLSGDWIKTVEPVMCAYKLVTCEFKWWGLQSKVESMIIKAERRIFFNFHRQVFCWTDKWHGLTMEDIRKLEDETKKELDEARATGEVRGTVGEE